MLFKLEPDLRKNPTAKKDIQALVNQNDTLTEAFKKINAGGWNLNKPKHWEKVSKWVEEIS